MSEKNKLIPGLPSGFEDRWNKTLILKKRLLKVIENNFIKYGFDPLETPSFEKTETLMGQYGDEGDRLIFKIINSGEKVKKADFNSLKKGISIGLERMPLIF